MNASPTSHSVALEAPQQPLWDDLGHIGQVRERLASLPPLVSPESVRELRELLAEVALGNAKVLQAGDCAEDPAACTPADVSKKTAFLHSLADVMVQAHGQQVLRVGRIAGQYAKPRSAQIERVNDLELPTYRGHLVNGPEPDPGSRQPDPDRLLLGYRSAAEILAHLRGDSGTDQVWTSHEALLLDYERPQVRRDRRGRATLTSTHWPWVGERTRHVGGAHVSLLSEIDNPVACKVGPRATVDEVLAVCARLDPAREPGRLTLITRMGAHEISGVLPPLVHAVQRAGHRVIWMTDPMHGNTVVAACGRKSRVVSTIIREVSAFQESVTDAGGVLGGIHLEATHDAIGECVDSNAALARLAGPYTTLCDPRLNHQQALAVVTAWGAGLGATSGGAT